MRHNILPDSDAYQSNIPGWRVVLTVHHEPGGDTVGLFCHGDLATALAPEMRPSVVGIEGFDDLWAPGAMLAYNVPATRTAALVAELEAAESDLVTTAPAVSRPELYWG